MTNTTPAAITYGDTFTLPSITHAATGNPVIFSVEDVRGVETAGEMYERRAAFVPLADDDTGRRLNALHAVKIGRTERTASAVSDFSAREHRAYETGVEISAYSTENTEKMNDAVRADFAALTFHLPTFTVPELRAALIDAAERHGRSIGRLYPHAARAEWDSYQQDADAHALRGEAMDKATRQAMHAAMIAAFTEQTADALKIGA